MVQLKKHILTQVEAENLRHAFHIYHELANVLRNLQPREYLQISGIEILLLQQVEALKRRGLDIDGQTMVGNSEYGFRIILPIKQKWKEKCYYFKKPFNYYFNKKIKQPELRMFKRYVA